MKTNSIFLEIYLVPLYQYICPKKFGFLYKNYADGNFFKGMIDIHGYAKIDKVANEFVSASGAGDWSKAMEMANTIEYLMQNLTYHVDRYNILRKVEPIYQIRKMLRYYK